MENFFVYMGFSVAIIFPVILFRFLIGWYRPSKARKLRNKFRVEVDFIDLDNKSSNDTTFRATSPIQSNQNSEERNNLDNPVRALNMNAMKRDLQYWDVMSSSSEASMDSTSESEESYEEIVKMKPKNRYIRRT